MGQPVNLNSTGHKAQIMCTVNFHHLLVALEYIVERLEPKYIGLEDVRRLRKAAETLEYRSGKVETTQTQRVIDVLHHAEGGLLMAANSHMLKESSYTAEARSKEAAQCRQLRQELQREQ